MTLLHVMICEEYIKEERVKILQQRSQLSDEQRTGCVTYIKLFHGVKSCSNFVEHGVEGTNKRSLFANKRSEQ